MHPFNVTEFDKLWLKTVYEKLLSNERPKFRNIRVALKDKLPKEYHPDQIDEKLARWKGTDISLIGMDLVAPEMEYKPKANRIVLAIRQLLLSNSEIDRIETRDIAVEIGLPESEVGLILMGAGWYGKLHNGGGMKNSYQGYSSIRLEDPNDEIFEEYLFFKDIDVLIDHHYNNEKAKRQQADKFLPRKLESQGSIDDNSSITVRPLFVSRVQKNPSICFVLMPFTQPWSTDVFKKIKTVVEKNGYQCLRADNQTSRIVLEDIWAGINQAAFIIADVTGRNPNVMYELGIADTVGTPVILITQEIDNIPFDFRHYRHIQYSDKISGWNDAEQQIENTITAIVGINKKQMH